MLDARHHFLADIAAFLEIDAAELVHVGIVREGVVIDEVEPAARHAERDAMRFIGGLIDERRAELPGDIACQMRGQDHAQAERGQARIGIDEAVLGRAAAVPDRQARRGRPRNPRS